MQMPISSNSWEIFADPGLDLDLFQEEFCRTVGIPASIPVSVAINQLTGGLMPPAPENKEKINYLLAFVAAQKPASLLEAQLLIQMLSAHQLCTKMLKKASNETWPDEIEKFVNIAMKLSRGYKKSLESLAKYRRDGKQFLYIEHVHIEKDANAVIGTVGRG